jgi:hypothetical protein
VAKSEVNLLHVAIARRVVFVLVAVAVILPFVVDFALPFLPSQDVKKLYDRIESLEPGSPVLMAFDYEPASEAELYPMSRVLLLHCFRRGLVPIVMTHWQAGVGLCQELCEKSAADAKKKWGKEKRSGRDYVLLGFKPGYADLVLNMGENLKGAFEKDFYGQPTRGMAALEGVDSLKDIPLAVDVAAGATVEMWIAYGADRFGFDLGAGTTAVMAPDLYPFYQSGQIIGFLGGLRGAADYETLLKESGRATTGMQAQSTTHILIIALILGANFRYVYRRFIKRSEG